MNKDMIFGFIAFLVFVGVLAWIVSVISHEILFGVLVGLVPSGILFYQERQKAKRDERNWLLRNKEACLIEVIDALISGFQDKGGNKEEKANKIVEKFQMLQSPLLIWGSPYFIRAWNRFRQASLSGDTENITRECERFFRAIRKELGHDDSPLKPGEVWATMMKPEEVQKVLDACKGEVYEEDMQDDQKQSQE